MLFPGQGQGGAGSTEESGHACGRCARTCSLPWPLVEQPPLPSQIALFTKDAVRGAVGLEAAVDLSKLVHLCLQGQRECRFDLWAPAECRVAVKHGLSLTVRRPTVTITLISLHCRFEAQPTATPQNQN